MSIADLTPRYPRFCQGQTSGFVSAKLAVLSIFQLGLSKRRASHQDATGLGTFAADITSLASCSNSR